MTPLYLVEFGEDGNPAEDVALTDMIRSACASPAILRKLGFVLTGTVHHPEDGDVWD